MKSRNVASPLSLSREAAFSSRHDNSHYHSRSLMFYRSSQKYPICPVPSPDLHPLAQFRFEFHPRNRDISHPAHDSAALHLRSWPLSSDATSSMCTWSHSCLRKNERKVCNPETYQNLQVKGSVTPNYPLTFPNSTKPAILLHRSTHTIHGLWLPELGFTSRHLQVLAQTGI